MITFFCKHLEMKINKSLLFFLSLQKLHIFYWDVYAFVSVLIITPTIVFSFLIKKEEERESTHLKDTITQEYSWFLRFSPAWQRYCFLFRSLPCIFSPMEEKNWKNVPFLTQLLSLSLFKTMCHWLCSGALALLLQPSNKLCVLFISAHLWWPWVASATPTRIRYHCKHWSWTVTPFLSLSSWPSITLYITHVTYFFFSFFCSFQAEPQTATVCVKDIKLWCSSSFTT